MSSSATDPIAAPSNTAPVENTTPVSPNNKGKGKGPAIDEPMDEDEEEDEAEDDDDDDDDDADEDEDEDEDEEETYDEIDPSTIVNSGRRTRGVRVDYTSQEALAKAGLKSGDADDDEDEDVDMN